MIEQCDKESELIKQSMLSHEVSVQQERAEREEYLKSLNIATELNFCNKKLYPLLYTQKLESEQQAKELAVEVARDFKLQKQDYKKHLQTELLNRKLNKLANFKMH